jgi:Emfourin
MVVRIRVERSGGFAGIPISNEIDGKDLPLKIVTTARKLMATKKSSSVSLGATPKGAADHFTYKIFIQDGTNRSVIECNQYSMQEELKSLIRYVEKNSEKGKL